VNAMQKSRQFCSVCKDWLEMEVVPTGDGEDDDGVIWFRCPQCQGFLPKLSGGDSDSGDDSPGKARDGEDDDGVIWYRCPQCQGFLPKLSGGDSDSGDDSPGEAREEAVSVADTPPVAETVLADLDPVDGEDLIPDDAPADLPGNRAGGSGSRRR